MTSKSPALSNGGAFYFPPPADLCAAPTRPCKESAGKSRVKRSRILAKTTNGCHGSRKAARLFAARLTAGFVNQYQLD